MGYIIFLRSVTGVNENGMTRPSPYGALRILVAGG